MASLPVRAPFRLDLTANALRRLSTNVVDLFTPADGFVRAHRGVLIVVRQAKRDAPLDVLVLGQPDFDARALVVRMLGTDRDLRPFYRAVKALPWLDALAGRMRGIKPPRYPTLWEAIVNAVVFQQVSIHAASAILRRVVEALAEPVEHQGRRLYPFFEPGSLLRADAERLRKLGLSVNKVQTLRAIAGVIDGGGLGEIGLAELPTEEAMARLMTLKGIGPWTAAVICLRGLGRLDVFPMDDSGVARAMHELAGEQGVDMQKILGILGPQRGMLYYHLLLARLEAGGQLETAATPLRTAQPRLGSKR